MFKHRSQLFRIAHKEKSRPLTLRSAAGAASVPPHGNGLLVLDDIAEEGEGTLKTPSVDGLGSLAGVLERGAEVAAASPGGLCVVDRGGCVADLRYQLAGVANACMRDAARESVRSPKGGGRRTIVMCGGCPVWLVEVVVLESKFDAVWAASATALARILGLR